MKLNSNRDSTAGSAVRIAADNVSLHGEFIVPVGAFGLVLFAHGSGSSRLSPRNQFVAERIRAHGFGTLLFDLLTEDEATEDQASGALRFDIPLLARRLVGATEWVCNQPAIRHLPVGYFGSSTGAAAALIAATHCTERVRAIVSRGGRPDLAGEALGSVAAPTLLIVGKRDEVVIDLNRDALRKLRGECELTIVAGATHLFEEPGALAHVAELAAQWFRSHLHEIR